MTESMPTQRGRSVVPAVAAILVVISCVVSTAAQDDGIDDSTADPVKLFERGQNAHARGQFEKALAFYEQAISVRPQFPEAEFQKGSALVALNRLPEAEAAFRRAIALKNNWALPYAALGNLLLRLQREREAEPILRQALRLDADNQMALRALTEARLRAGDANGALVFARQATADKSAPASLWVLRSIAEKGAGDAVAALASVNLALQLEPGNIAALEQRSDLHLEQGAYEKAITDLEAARLVEPDDKQILNRLMVAYDRAGRKEEAKQLATVLGVQFDQTQSQSSGVVGTPEEIEAANSEDPVVARPALEELLAKNPKAASLLGRLGTLYRTEDPAKSMNYFRRAAELEPTEPSYATGYAGALVQARRFAEAVTILRQVLAIAPETYTAHANLATALYELKLYAEALPQFEWLLKAKPDLVVAYYFIATAHDYLGEFQEALTAYETFLARADADRDRLEIGKVNLRLPSLRRQLQLGQGVKHKYQ
jgi:tetratricopeptide (TPR) repeat protein